MTHLKPPQQNAATAESPSETTTALADDASAIVAIAAHEIKNALGGLSVALARCEQVLASGKLVTKEHISTARGELRRISALVNDLLDGSRVDLGVVHIVAKPIDIGELARDVVTMFEAARHRSVHLVLPSESLVVVADAERVRSVLINYLENAAKYAPASSDIQVNVEVLPAGAGVRIAVVDQGPGVSVDDQARLFERFYRSPSVASRAPGLGLGLYVCRSVATAHGGRVGVDSTPGQGASFWIELPQTPPP